MKAYHYFLLFLTLFFWSASLQSQVTAEWRGKDRRGIYDEKNLLKKWQSFEKKQPLKEIQSFAQEMIDLGTRYKLGFISEYGQQLLSAIENFEIEEMRTKLESFPNLIKQLKRINHES